MQPIPGPEIGAVTRDVVERTPFLDIHTHLFAPHFGELGLWGIDSLLTYHYLEAELFRFAPIQPAEYWTLPLTARADLIWRVLFVENAPISEATRGVIAVLHALGLETSAPDLEPLRGYFRQQDLAEYIPRVFQLAGVSKVVMTNDPLDPVEVPHWANPRHNPLFAAALRLDRLFQSPPPEPKRLLLDWAGRMKAAYMAVSLPDSFTYPANDVRHSLLCDAVLPACRELDIPLALMIGVRRQVNPALKLAGDGSARTDLTSLAHICEAHPENRFLVSVLSRENQHELCVYARKFSNLMPFGCWWFLNNPSIVEEITRERLEMLGASFIAQNSDARVLEQLIYKWKSTRRTIGPIIAERFERLAEDGRPVTRADIEGVVTRLFRTNYERFMS